MIGAPASCAKVDQQELWFLILHHIASSPAANTVPALEAELRKHDLLPGATDYLGRNTSLSYEQLAVRHSNLDGDHLTALLKQYLQVRENNAGRRVTSSLLTLSVDAGSSQRGEAPTATVFPSTRLLLTKSLAQKLMLRECGLGPRQGSYTASALTEKRVFANKFRHKRTFRGHTCPVYCIAVDQHDRYVITCSDDCLVKIWSMATGVLLMTCRGHETEVSDVKVSTDGQYLATGCNAGIIRVWSLDPSTLGHPVAVLHGSDKPVTFLDWNAAAPSVLASTSTDGACRVWDALTGLDPVTLRPSATFGHLSGSTELSTRALRAAANVDATTGMPLVATPGPSDVPPTGAAANEFELITCNWTPCGEYLVAGGNNAVVYMWYWGLKDKLASLSVSASQSLSLPSSILEAPFEFARKDWPVLREHCCLRGHRNNVSCVKFSHSGTQLATSSHDGTFRVFKPVSHRAPRKRHGEASAEAKGKDRSKPWQDQYTISCAPLPRSAANVRRRQALTTPKVQQVEWSADDSYIIAVLDDNSIRVFDMLRPGSAPPEQVHVLTQHTRAVYEVAIHPEVSTIFASWSYDGTIILWDLITGVPLKTFSMRDTYPGRGQWADDGPISLLGATWSKSGTGFFAVDCAGQWHTFGLGSADVMSRAMYDQFWRYDYGELARDARGGMLDVASGQAPHVNPSKRVHDFFQHPYEAPYSELAAKNQLSRGLPAQNWKTGHAPRSVISATPLMSAVEWHVRTNGRNRGDLAVQSALEQCSLHQDAVMERVLRGEITIPNEENPDLKWVPCAKPSNPVLLTGSVPRPPALGTPGQRPAPARTPGVATIRNLPQSRGTGQHRTFAVAYSSEDEPIISEDDNADANYEDSDGDDPDLIFAAGAGRRQTRTAAVASGVRPGPGLTRTQPRYRSEEEMSISYASESEEEEWSSDEGSRPSRGRRARNRGRTTGRSRQPSQRAMESATMLNAPTRRSRRQAANGGRGMYQDDSDIDALGLEDADLFLDPEQVGEQRRSRQAAARAERRERRKTRPTSERRSSRSRSKKRSRSAAREQNVQHVQSSSMALIPRPDECYEWLLTHDLNADFYYPQVGDDVVYIRDLHDTYLHSVGDSISLTGPAQIPVDHRDRHGRFFRKFEPCRVAEVKYLISDDGERRTLARITLVLAEPAAPGLANRPFNVAVPSPLSGHKEFVILRRQFERAVTAPVFAVDSRVKGSYYDSSHEFKASWYHGSLVEDKLEGQQVALCDAWDEPRILNRYKVKWDPTGESGIPQGDDDSDVEENSPWELHAPPVTVESLATEFKVPDQRVQEMRGQLCAACTEVWTHQDVPEYPFKTQPAFDQKIEYERRRKRCYAAIVPLPITVNLIMERIGHDFYRSFDQLLLDVSLLQSNAELFFARDSDSIAIACSIVRFLHAVAHGTSPATLQAFEAALQAEESEDLDDDGTGTGTSDHTRRTSRAHSRIGSDDDAPGPSHGLRSSRRLTQIIENDTDNSDDDDDRPVIPPYSPVPAASVGAEAENDGLQSQAAAAGAAPGAVLGAHDALLSSPLKRPRTQMRSGGTGRQWQAAARRLGTGTADEQQQAAVAQPRRVRSNAVPSDAAAGPAAAGLANGATVSTTPPSAERDSGAGAAPQTKIRLKRRLPDSSVPPELGPPGARQTPGASPMVSSEADGASAPGPTRASKRARRDSDAGDREASSRASRSRRTRGAPEQESRRPTRAGSQQVDYTGMYQEDLEEDAEALQMLTVAQLKQRCTQLGLEFDKRANKQFLVTLLVSQRDV